MRDRTMTMKTSTPFGLILFLLVVGSALMGCRGAESQSPPVHLNPNMDNQQRYGAQEANPLFEDGRAMRTPVVGTVARGLLYDDTEFYHGRTQGGDYVTSTPIEISEEVLRRGQERYNIYCSVCHSPSGDGLGIIITGQYGYTPPPSIHDPRIVDESDGYLYDVITNGVRTMPAYGHQVAVADRWAIVSYIRALQRSQNASLDDIPPDERSGLRLAQDSPTRDSVTDDDGAADADTAGDAASDDDAAGADTSEAAQ